MEDKEPLQGFTPVQLAIARQRFDDELANIRKEKDKAWQLETKGLRVLEGRELMDAKREWQRKKLEEQQQKLDKEGLVIVDHPMLAEELIENGSEEEDHGTGNGSMIGPRNDGSIGTGNVSMFGPRNDGSMFYARQPRQPGGRLKPRLLRPGEVWVKRPRRPARRRAANNSNSQKQAAKIYTPGKVTVTLIGDQRPEVPEGDKARMKFDGIDFLQNILPQEMEKFLKQGDNPKTEGCAAMEKARLAVLDWFKNEDNEPWKLLAADGASERKDLGDKVLELLPESARYKEEVARQGMGRWISTLNQATSAAHDADSSTRKSVEDRLVQILVMGAGLFAHKYDIDNIQHFHCPYKELTMKDKEEGNTVFKSGLADFSDNEWKEMAPLLVAMMVLMRMMLAKKKQFLGPTAEGSFYGGKTFTFADVYTTKPFRSYVDNVLKNLKKMG